MASTFSTRGFGFSTIEAEYNHLQVSSDGRPTWLPGGATIDWDTIPVLSADTRFVGEDYLHKSGDKVLPYGTIMTRITSDVPANTSNIGAYVPYNLLADDADGASLAAGHTADDGRKTLGPEVNSFILNRTIRKDGFGILNRENTRHVSGIVGGAVYFSRLWLSLHPNVGTTFPPTIDADGNVTYAAYSVVADATIGKYNGLPAGPTLAIFKTAFPLIRFAQTGPTIVGTVPY